MYIAPIIFRFEDTFLQIAAPPVKAACPLVVGVEPWHPPTPLQITGPKPLVVVGASDSVIVTIASRTVVVVALRDPAPLVDSTPATSLVAPGLRE